MKTPKTEITVPVSPFERDEQGLLKSVEYVRNADGSVNYRAMIPQEFLVPNKDNFKKRGEEVPDSIEGLEDKDLLILLAGIKAVARLRGYTDVSQVCVPASESFVCATTKITWIPNFETNGQVVSFSDSADAHLNNTNGFGKYFLSAISANRSFVRAVRNFLGINIVGQDEVGGEAPESSEAPSNSGGDVYKLLKSTLDKNNIKFQQFKNKMIEQQQEGAENWESLTDVPAAKVFEIVDLVKGLIAAKKAKKSETPEAS